MKYRDEKVGVVEGYEGKEYGEGLGGWGVIVVDGCREELKGDMVFGSRMKVERMGEGVKMRLG